MKEFAKADFPPIIPDGSPAYLFVVQLYELAQAIADEAPKMNKEKQYCPARQSSGLID